MTGAHSDMGHVHSRIMAVFLLVASALIPLAPLIRAQPARADERSPAPAAGGFDCDVTPYECDTSEAAKQRARLLFKDALSLIVKGRYEAGTVGLRKALKHWNHPRIHFYIADTLLNLDRIVAAYEHIVLALGHGEAGLEAEEYQKARLYERQLRRQIAILTVVCSEPDANVKLNGKPLSVGRASITLYLLPGEHELQARKRGFLPATSTVTLRASSDTQVMLHMVRQGARGPRRWAQWKPWTVLGGGLGLGLVGGLLDWRARANLRRFRDGFTVACPAGCNNDQLPGDIHLLNSRATWQRRTAYSAYSIAGAAILGGVALIYLNRPEEQNSQVVHNEKLVSVRPFLSIDHQGLSAYVRF